MKLPVRVLFFSLLGVLFLGTASWGLYQLYVHQQRLEDAMVLLATGNSSENNAQERPINSAQVPHAQQLSWIAVQRKAKDTVVQVFTQSFEFNWLEPFRAPDQREGCGTGFFINRDGEFLTNYHVVAQASHIAVQVPAMGQERLEAEVIGVSPDRDIALCRLTEKDAELLRVTLGGIPYLTLGDSDIVVRGQDVLALGYPLGQEHLKSTQGIISGREKVRLLNNQLCFQITAPLNPGNSGGPSLDAQGNVIGVNFAGVMLAQNVGYIIPINDIKIALKDLYSIKLLRKPFLGVMLLPSNQDMVEHFKNPPGGGYYVAKILKNSILEKAGVKDGDMIYEMNGHRLDYFGDTSVSWSEDKVSMFDLLGRYVVGDSVTLVVYRKGQRKEITFKLEPRFTLPIRSIYPEFEPEAKDYEIIAGMVVMELRLNHLQILLESAPHLVKFTSLENQYEPQLVVTHVLPTSPVSRIRGSGFYLVRPGVLISEVNGTKVSTLEEFRKAVTKSKSTGYLTVETSDNRFMVFSVKNILKDEKRLASTFLYKQSELVRDLERVAEH